MLKKNFWFVLAVAVLCWASLWARARGASRSATGRKCAGPIATARPRETGLPEKWALNGENFLWRVPYGGRSAPIVMGNRVYVQNPAGRGTDLQERVMCLDADTGKVVWEYKFNIFQSDVPPHRVGWASPAADPETGNIYALGVGATGRRARARTASCCGSGRIGEEFAAFTTHGGRTMSPLIDGDLVIVSAAVSNWGTMATARIRFIALDKRTGEIVYVVDARRPAVRHRLRVAAHRDDQRRCGCSSPATATAAFTPSSRKPAKRSGASSPRSAPSTPASWSSGNNVIVSHGDENLDPPSWA